MITFIDLLKNDDFRNYVSKRIAGVSKEQYTFSDSFPKLYRYRSLSTYSIDDIINGKITLSSIGEFNDIFDGALHQYGSDQEIEEAAEAKWEELETLLISARLPKNILQRDNIVVPYINHLKTESRLKFRELEYLGTYVCCFSKDSQSTLMWAHYADSNKGICIEYDFNNVPAEHIVRKSIFPIAYTPAPINVEDLLSENGRQIYQYPLDAAILCTALNKASIWQYEQEWRFVWVLTSSNDNKRRIPINSPVNPSRIYLGYHFLKAFFYYDLKDENERQGAINKIKKFMELINFMQKNTIPAAVMVPSKGSYNFESCEIPIDRLRSFMFQYFHDEQPESMRYYYTIHDHLMDLIGK